MLYTVDVEVEYHVAPSRSNKLATESPIDVTYAFEVGVNVNWPLFTEPEIPYPARDVNISSTVVVLPTLTV